MRELRYVDIHDYKKIKHIIGKNINQKCIKAIF